MDTEAAMGREYRGRVFKSGNSLALRLPKALGFAEGAEVILRGGDGRYVFEAVDAPRRKIDLTGIAGAVPGLRMLAADERLFDERPSAGELPETITRRK